MRRQAMRKAADEVGLKFTSIHIQPQSHERRAGIRSTARGARGAMQVLGLQEVVLPMFLMPAHLPKPDRQERLGLSAVPGADRSADQRG